ncbi:DUF4157 domain-containing protein [Nocardioides sp.]|uniref:eCIS core domain-containing protein n=1 Tax=Nocardioides sp. TaxID=35761 RepID=UPI003565C99C
MVTHAHARPVRRRHVRAALAERDRPTAFDLDSAEHPAARALAGLATLRRRRHADLDDPLGGSPVSPDVLGALQRRRGAGKELPDEVAGRFGEQLGVSLAGVRVHADSEAGEIARSVQATAFTHGSDVYFSPGSYDPGTSSGQRLLAHELAHVAQQDHAPTTGSGITVGRADDPAEAAADRVADHVVGALQRRAAEPAGPGPGPAVGSPGPTGPIRREVGTAKEDFTRAIEGAPPASKAEAATRMKALRVQLAALTTEQRTAISTDRAIMDKARAFVGDHEYMSLVTAVGMAHRAPAGGAAGGAGGAGGAAGPQHLSGGEADAFIREEMAKLGHLKPFIDAAVKAGKQAEGFVATVGDEDFTRIYETQNPTKTAAVGGRRTNAFIANKHRDRPAIIHHKKGTTSTAIHESMHRYSELKVLREFGSGLNEGITEYFTRLITHADGTPSNGNGASSTRKNYQKNWEFVGDLLTILGANQTEQQTELAEIYFNGDTPRLYTRFREGCEKAGLTAPQIAARWTEFKLAVKTGDWAAARAKFPPKAPAGALAEAAGEESPVAAADEPPPATTAGTPTSGSPATPTAATTPAASPGKVGAGTAGAGKASPGKAGAGKVGAGR